MLVLCVQFGGLLPSARDLQLTSCANAGLRTFVVQCITASLTVEVCSVPAALHLSVHCLVVHCDSQFSVG